MNRLSAENCDVIEVEDVVIVTNKPIVQLWPATRVNPLQALMLEPGLLYDESPHFFYLLSKLAPGPLRFLRSDVYPSTLGKVTPAAIDIKYWCQTEDYETIPVIVNMNFEATVSEWHVTVYGEKYMGDIDIFRDIYICLPNDGLHLTGTVIRTSALATCQHWIQSFTQGIKHLRGTLRYGNDVVFANFAAAVKTKKPAIDISANDALRILIMQHEVINNSKLLH